MSLTDLSLMSIKTLITVLLLSIKASSCYEPIQVVINNKSRVDKNIRVIYPGHFRLPINRKHGTNDSLLTYDHTLADNAMSTRDYYRYPTKIPVLSFDTNNRTYSFNLKAKHEVIIETRWRASTPTYGQMFIIDNLDTIELKRHEKPFKKKGGSWEYTIDDSKN